MASAECGSVLSGVKYGKKCPLPSQHEGLGDRRELPQRGSGAEPRPEADFGVF